jgi:hypothetical protein
MRAVIRDSSLGQRFLLSPGNRPNNQERFPPCRHGIRQRRIRRLVRQVFLASKEAQKCPPLLRNLIADSPAQHGIAALECVEYRALRHRTLDLEFNLAPDVRQRPKMLWKLDSNHDSLHRGFLNVEHLPIAALIHPHFAKDAI